MRVATLLDNPEALFELIVKYETALDESLHDVIIAGKTLEHANREQPELFYKYGRLQADCDSAYKFVNMRADIVRSRAFQKMKEGSDRALADRVIDKYVESDQDLVDLVCLSIQLGNLREKFAAVMQALTSRGYALRNITEARVNQLHTAVL
jgi:Recombination, repair and ssDNA binding protein UvsY